MLNEMASHGLLIHTHTVNVDEHYEGGGAKVRVSKNKKTNQVKEESIIFLTFVLGFTKWDCK